MEWIFTTESGSRYLVRQFGGRWFVVAEISTSPWLKDLSVEIYPPMNFPPAVGQRAYFQATGEVNVLMPYGLLVTGPIVEIWGQEWER